MKIHFQISYYAMAKSVCARARLRFTLLNNCGHTNQDVLHSTVDYKNFVALVWKLAENVNKISQDYCPITYFKRNSTFQLILIGRLLLLSTQGRRNRGIGGCSINPHILANSLSLFQSGGQIMTIYPSPLPPLDFRSHPTVLLQHTQAIFDKFIMHGNVTHLFAVPRGFKIMFNLVSIPNFMNCFFRCISWQLKTNCQTPNISQSLLLSKFEKARDSLASSKL